MRGVAPLVCGRSSNKTGQHRTHTVGFSGPGSWSTGLEGKKKNVLIIVCVCVCTKFIVWDKMHILGKIASSKDVGGVFGLFSNFWPPTWTEMRRNGTSKWIRSKGKCWCLADLVLWGRSHQVWSTIDERMNWDSHQATSSPVYHHQPERILENYKHDHANVHMIIKIRTNLTNICTTILSCLYLVRSGHFADCVDTLKFETVSWVDPEVAITAESCNISTQRVPGHTLYVLMTLLQCVKQLT